MFFSLNVVSWYSFLLIPEFKQDTKENTEVIKPSNCFLPLT